MKSLFDTAASVGLTLEGLVPVESLDSAARALVRASLGPRPPRDLASSRRSAFGYAILRLAPRRMVDAVMLRHLRRAAKRGHFDHSELAAPLRDRLMGETSTFRV